MRILLVLAFIGAIGFGLGYASKRPSASEAHAPSSAGGRWEDVLRRGDPASSLAAMERLAKEDPEAFFKSLRSFPDLKELPSVIAIAASRLAEEDPEEAAKILNAIGSTQQRKAAWLQFIKSLGKLGISERIGIARLAKDNPLSLAVAEIVIPAAEEDPEGTLRALRDGAHREEYGAALAVLGSRDHDQAVEMLKEAFSVGFLDSTQTRDAVKQMVHYPSSDPSEKFSVLPPPVATDSSVLPPVELIEESASELSFVDPSLGPQQIAVLKSLGEWISSDDYPDGLGLEHVFVTAFETSPDAGILDAIVLLPDMRKNLVLANIDPNFCRDVETLATMFNAMNSPELQQQKIVQWFESEHTPEEIAELTGKLTNPKSRAAVEALAKQPEE